MRGLGTERVNRRCRSEGSCLSDGEDREERERERVSRVFVAEETRKRREDGF